MAAQAETTGSTEKGGMNMIQGKYKMPPGKRQSQFKRVLSSALFLSILLIVVLVTKGTVAWLSDKSDPLENKFTPSKVSSEVVETFDGTVKSDVQIKNTGDTAAYVRATVIFSWKDTAGNVYGGRTPVATNDYIISYGTAPWIRHTDGYWYYTSPVAPNANTNVLISSVQSVSGQAPAGYTLSVQILADAIQSVPARAVTESWGINPSSLGN